jgi:chemotaxis protein MotB
MARRKDAGHGGGHGWFVTFADLMGLLVSFFVMLVAFSTQDQGKMQAVAGSMRDAFGVQQLVRYSGIIEVSGLPTRPKLKNAANIPPEESSATPTPSERDRNRASGAKLQDDKSFALAAASLRQALQDLPDLTALSKQVIVEESKDGLNVEIVDQDGRSMFPEDSKEPYERARRLIQKLSPMLKAAPFRISITGHTASRKSASQPGYGPWDLSVDRSNAVRRILEEEGVPASQFFMVGGKADTQPLFPDDPFVSANRRITITLMREDPPLPMGFKP